MMNMHDFRTMLMSPRPIYHAESIRMNTILAIIKNGQNPGKNILEHVACMPFLDQRIGNLCFINFPK